MTPTPESLPERRYTECPKCGARGGCAKHGLSPTGIDLRARGIRAAVQRIEARSDEIAARMGAEFVLHDYDAQPFDNSAILNEGADT